MTEELSVDEFPKPIHDYKDESFPKPIHDYKDESIYPNDTDISALWIWEFMRRGVVHQYLCDAEDDEDEEQPPWDHTEGAATWALSWHYTENRTIQDAPDDLHHKSGAFPWHICGPLAGPDILLYHDPFTDEISNQDHMHPYFSQFAQDLYDGRERIDGLDDRLLVIALDAGQPLNSQIKRLEELHAKAHKQLKQVDKHGVMDVKYVPTATRTRGFCMLLRLLDGLASGATEKEIRNELQLHEDKDYRRRIDRAEYFAKEGYKKLRTWK